MARYETLTSCFPVFSFDKWHISDYTFCSVKCTDHFICLLLVERYNFQMYADDY